LGHLPTVAIISLKLFSVACTLVGRPGLGLCFIVIVSLLGPCDAIVVANFVTISLSQARIQSQPGHISGRWTFRGCGSPAKVITCYISLFPKAVPLAIIHLLCNIAFWPGSVLVGFGGGCVYVIFAYWRCKLMASLTIVTVVLNGILLGITRIPFHRFVLSVPHSPIQGPLVMGLVSMME